MFRIIKIQLRELLSYIKSFKKLPFIFCHPFSEGQLSVRRLFSYLFPSGYNTAVSVPLQYNRISIWQWIFASPTHTHSLTSFNFLQPTIVKLKSSSLLEFLKGITSMSINQVEATRFLAISSYWHRGANTMKVRLIRSCTLQSSKTPSTCNKGQSLHNSKQQEDKKKLRIKNGTHITLMIIDILGGNLPFSWSTDCFNPLPRWN